MNIGKAISFNPSESIQKGSISKKIPMASLTEFQRNINSYELSSYSSGPKFRNGDTLLSKITPCLENGKTAYVDILEDDEVAFGSSEFIVLRETEYTDSEYVYYLAISPTFRKRAISCMEGTSGRKRVNENTLKYFELPFPDKFVQKQIAKILSDLDAKIAINNTINQELEALAKTIYDYWFVQFDFPCPEGLEGQTHLAGKPYKSSGGKMVYNEELKREIPEGWECKRFNELVYQVNDSIEPHEYPELNYLPIDKLPTQKLYYADYESRNEANSSLIKFLEDDILLGAMRVYFHRVCNAIEDGISRSTMMVLRPLKKMNKNFGLFALNRDEAIAYATKNSTGTSIPYAKWSGNLENYKCCLPDDEKLLIKFNEIVNPILESFKIYSKENQKLAALRDWLLPMLMNGQVTVGKTYKESGETMGLAAEGGDIYKKSNNG